MADADILCQLVIDDVQKPVAGCKLLSVNFSAIEKRDDLSIYVKVGKNAEKQLWNIRLTKSGYVYLTNK